ncbi:MAG: hypothetical protein IT376_23250 [Polyangiaceae bacterium]|nr:hypothetical protein [Polyangiaceae bacterium]
MTPRPVGPGRYDRRVTPAERLLAQRNALRDATARTLLECPRPSVREILSRSGLSRATFYTHYADLSAARADVGRAAAAAVERALAVLLPSASSLPDRLRAVPLALAAAHRAVPALLAAARLPSHPAGNPSPLSETLTAALSHCVAPPTHPGDTPAPALVEALSQTLLAVPPDLLLPPSDLPTRLAEAATTLLTPL